MNQDLADGIVLAVDHALAAIASGRHIDILRRQAVAGVDGRLDRSIGPELRLPKIDCLMLQELLCVQISDEEPDLKIVEVFDELDLVPLLEFFNLRINLFNVHLARISVDKIQMSFVA